MFFGIGRTIHEVYGPVEVIPHPSSTSYACARLGWSVEDVAVVSLVGRPVDALTAALHVHRRVLVLSEGADTPQVVARLLTQRGFGATRMRVLERLGASDERVLDGIATSWGHVPGAALNVIALDVDGAQLSLVPGLPDDTYAHDGQLTKRYVRAATLAALAPRPGELLWDVGGGSGSIALEWLRAHPSCQAVSVERDAVRAGRISENAATLGIPRLRVVHAAAPEGLTDLPVPDAIFIGGGLTNPGLLDACWQALPVGGRLVANTVTIESEHVLAEFYRLHGGELIKLSVSNVAAIGGFTGWRAALPVTQLSVVKEEK
jgi:precorrin-6Y C5,15-methyltransferase (decarboxylating)